MTFIAQIALRARIHNLRGQAHDLRDPARRSGPSRYEVEERAAQLEREADEASEELYWEMTREQLIS